MINCAKTNAIAIINMESPPVNALGLGMRIALIGAIRERLEDDSIKAIIIGSSLPLFCGGADIQEFKTGELWTSPDLAGLYDEIDGSSKLVVAAINGTAMGGALELALACDYRIARRQVKLGLPEVKLGLLPGAGGTQRLPRITNLEFATKMILSGNPVDAEKALSAGLIDEIAEDDADFQRQAIKFVENLLESNAPLRPCGHMHVDRSEIGEGFFADARATIATKTYGQIALETCIQSIEASCSLSLDEGLHQEKEAFRKLLDSPQSRALQHLFFAERGALKIPGVPADTNTRTITSAAVIGAGTMGIGIAIAFIDAGITTKILDMSEDNLEHSIDKIRDHYDKSVAKGRMDPLTANLRKDLITGTLYYGDLADVDLVVEAVFESMDVKKTVFKTLNGVCKPGAILASNTSTLNLDDIANTTSRPEDVIGLHFFSPANIMRLLEIVRGDKTSNEVVKTAVTFAKAIKKSPVVVGVCYGFVGNRMLEPYFREGSRLLLEGATPEQVDGVLTEFGMAMGIISMADMAGIDVGYRVRDSRRDEISHDPSYQAVQDRLFELGRYGQKTGRGCYIYEGREKKTDPELISICETLAHDLGVERRVISDEEILERCLYPLINEGIQLLDEGISYRSGDCDVIWVNGYGFPAWRGGPLHYAEEIGLDRVLAGMQKYQKELGAYGDMWFQPAPLLERLVESGETLSNLST